MGASSGALLLRLAFFLAAASLILALASGADEDSVFYERVENVKSQVDQIKKLPRQQASNFLTAVDQLLANLINAIPRLPTPPPTSTTSTEKPKSAL